MAYKWTILKAAVEQEILFPSIRNYEEYKKKLERKDEPYEVISETPQDDNSIIVTMRKRYNYNAFLRSRKCNLQQKPISEPYSLATCYIEFKESDFAIAVNRRDKETAEIYMKEAYACWCSQDVKSCILPDYDEQSICQSCYGDFIRAWVREKGVCCDEDLGLIPLPGYCVDTPDDFEDIDISDWRDERVTYYWFLKKDIEDYCKVTEFDFKKYIQMCSKDDVDCDLLPQFEYVFKFNEKE